MDKIELLFSNVSFDSRFCRVRDKCEMYPTKSYFSFLSFPFFSLSLSLQKISMRIFNLAMNDWKTFSSRELNSYVGIKTARWSTNECRKLTNNRCRIGVFKSIPLFNDVFIHFPAREWKRKGNDKYIHIYIYTHRCVYEWILNRHRKFTYLTPL